MTRSPTCTCACEPRTASPTVVIALGANLGDPLETLHDAAISLHGLIDIIAVSPLVETDPVGGPEQPAYLNAVVTGTTHLAPSSVLAGLHDIERAPAATARCAGGRGRSTST